tara:strand:+ start:3495 stop:3860 length:366 start_codon:yes stop_codon:yes gene_type:complete
MSKTSTKNKKEIKTIAISDLKPRPDNPRLHSEKQIKKLSDSIQRFGFIGHIVVDENLNILAGHGRHLAAKQAGLKEVPTPRDDRASTPLKVYVMHLTKFWIRNLSSTMRTGSRKSIINETY